MNPIFKAILKCMLAAVLISCAEFRMRPLIKTAEDHNCFVDRDDSRTVYASIEEELIRQGALKSRKINMESGIGMIEKTVRLFVLNPKEIRMVFHLMHSVDLEIKDFGFAIQGDSGTLISGEMQVDHRVTIGGMTEEHAYLTFPADKLTQLLEDRQISILLQDFLFYLPYNCRETFREIRQKDKAR